MSVASRLRQHERETKLGITKPNSGSRKQVRREAFKPTPLNVTALALEANAANKVMGTVDNARKFGLRGAFGNPLLNKGQRTQKRMQREASKHLAGMMND